MREPLREQARALAREAAVLTHAHRFSAEAWSWARYLLGVPAAVLAALAGYFALGDDNLGWGGLMALAAAGLSTLLTVLKPGEEVPRHQLAATRFADVRRRLERLAEVDGVSSLSDVELQQRFDVLLDSFGKAEEEAPNLTQTRRATAFRYVRSGEVPRSGRFIELIGRIARTGAIAVAAALVLLVANWFVRKVLDREIPGGLWGGLVFAVVVYGLAFAGLWRLGTSSRVRSALAGAFFSVAFVVMLPLLLASRPMVGERVATAGQVPSKLDVVLIVSAKRFTPDEARIPPRVTGHAWSVEYSVGARVNGAIEWRLRSSPSRDDALLAAAGADGSPGPPPTFRAGSDRIVLLVPDPIPPTIARPDRQPDSPAQSAEVVEWLGALRVSGLEIAPTFALLATHDRARVARWERALKPTRGGAVTVAELGGQALTDAAELLVTETLTSRSDFGLALRHRPHLLFDHKEREREWPLDIESFFASGRVQLCKATAGGSDCNVVIDPAALENGNSHLRLTVQRPRLRAIEPRSPTPRAGPTSPPPSAPPPAGPPSAPPSAPPPSGPPSPPPGQSGSAYYVHVVRRPAEARIYLDYWWYLPYNPSVGLSGALCGPGFTIAGLTCFDHQSDWEGVVVVLDSSKVPPRPIAVNYAQHERIVSYAWPYLQAKWKPQPVDERPRVYIARNSHAAYPFRCDPPRDPPCRQKVDPRPEGRHDGERPWPYNHDAACASACLRALPTRTQGREPALWNAFEGPWGEQNCILRIYCDVGGAPRAPSHHRRYRDPSRADRRIGFMS